MFGRKIEIQGSIAVAETRLLQALEVLTGKRVQFADTRFIEPGKVERDRSHDGMHLHREVHIVTNFTDLAPNPSAVIRSVCAELKLSKRESEEWYVYTAAVEVGKSNCNSEKYRAHWNWSHPLGDDPTEVAIGLRFNPPEMYIGHDYADRIVRPSAS